jgi:predicted CoA-binding protein
MYSPANILTSAKAILVVDWPGAGVPRALLNAGFTVFGYSPGGYTLISVAGDDEAKLNFTKIEGSPAGVDIVNIYRPENELAGIFESLVLPLAAKTIWLHPPLTSAWARNYAAEHSLNFMEGVNIAEVAKGLGNKLHTP